MKNPNPYDEERFQRGSNEIVNAVTEVWEAGGTLSDISSAVQDGLPLADNGEQRRCAIEDE
jgi:hypothetical protein